MKSVASCQQVGEYVTRQATPRGRDFGGLKAGSDGIEFSPIPLQKGWERAVL